MSTSATLKPDGASAMRYAARLLDRPRRLVWIFPQGAERPVTLRPLGRMGVGPGKGDGGKTTNRART